MSKVHVVYVSEECFTDSHGALNTIYFELLVQQFKEVYEIKDHVLFVPPGQHRVGAFYLQGMREKKAGSRPLDEIGDGFVGLMEMMGELRAALKKVNLLGGYVQVDARAMIQKKTRTNNLLELQDMLTHHRTTVPIVVDEKFNDQLSFELAATLAFNLHASSLIYLSTEAIVSRAESEAMAFNQKKVGESRSFFPKSGVLRDFCNYLEKKPQLKGVYQIVNAALMAQGCGLQTHLAEASKDKVLLRLISGENIPGVTVFPESKSIKR